MGSRDLRRERGEKVRTSGITSSEVHDRLAYAEDGKTDAETDHEEQARCADGLDDGHREHDGVRWRRLQ